VVLKKSGAMSTPQELTEAIELVRQDITTCMAELQAINERKLEIVSQATSDDEFFSRTAEIQELNVKQRSVGARFAELRRKLEELEAQLHALDSDQDVDRSDT
jgi:predicted  nucleic acid-binding Zn-ribbon protein